LESHIDVIRDWMISVSQLGIPRFGETAGRLKQLRARLALHFDHETDISAQLTSLYASNSVELNGVRRQMDHDHRNLLQRFDELIQRLEELDPPFSSWESATEEVELLVVALEQHEDQEADSFRTLIPR
jgi:uncharacterized protein (DUF3084 family)